MNETYLWEEEISGSIEAVQEAREKGEGGSEQARMQEARQEKGEARKAKGAA